MKAKLYVQGVYWATLDVPGDSLLALLAQGMITRANLEAAALHQSLLGPTDVRCSVNIHIQPPVTYTLTEEKQP